MDKQVSELRLSYKNREHLIVIERRRGSGNVIVFLHGWGGSKEGFTGAFTSEALEEFDICALDLIGHGDSEKPQDFSYDLLDQASIVAEAVNSFNAKKVHLVGHSMGGSIGLIAAPLIKNLALFVSVESNLAPNGSGVDARTIARRPFWLFKSFTLPFIKTLLRLHPKKSIRMWAQWFDKADSWALYKSVQSLVRWSDSGKLLPSFTSLPHKAYIYSENGKRKKDVVPQLEETITYEIPACGHALITENPDDFYTTLATIVRKT